MTTRDDHCHECGRPYTVCPHCQCHYCPEYWRRCPRCIEQRDQRAAAHIDPADHGAVDGRDNQTAY